MGEVTNNMINKLSDSIKEEIKYYLKDDTLSHRFFISNILKRKMKTSSYTLKVFHVKSFLFNFIEKY